jgi:hypothetical protein
VNYHAATDIKDLEYINKDGFIKAEEEHFNSCHYPELENAAFAEDHTERNKYCTGAKVGQNKVLIVQRYLCPFAIGILMELYDIVPEASKENADLNGPTGDQIVESNGAP